MSLITRVRDAWRVLAQTEESGIAQPSPWLIDALGGAATSSSVRVNQSTALEAAPVMACVRILAEDIAKLPVKIFHHRADGGRDEVRNIPAWRTLAVRPNRWMTPFDFKAAMVSQYALNGNAFALINRDAGGRPVELVPIEAPRVTLWVNGDEMFYHISFSSELHRERFGVAGALVPAAEVIHVKFPISWQGLWGFSPIMMMREAIGTSLAVDRYAATLFANNADIGGVLISDKVLSPEAKQMLRTQWEGRYRGINQRAKTALLEDGVKFEKLSMTAEDAQYIGSRKFSVEEAARIWRIPPHKLMDLTRTIQSNIEQQARSYADDTLVPIVTNFEDEYTAKLLTGRQPTMLDIEHDMTAFVRADADKRWDIYTKAINWGIMSPNEVRISEGMNPRDGGNIYLTPVNMMINGELPAQADQRPPEAEALAVLTAYRERRERAGRNAEMPTAAKLLKGNGVHHVD